MDDGSFWIDFAQALFILAGVLFIIATLLTFLCVIKLVCTVPSSLASLQEEVSGEGSDRAQANVAEPPPPIVESLGPVLQPLGDSAEFSSKQIEEKEPQEGEGQSGGMLNVVIRRERSAEEGAPEVPLPDAAESAPESTSGPPQPDDRAEAVEKDYRAEASGDPKTSGTTSTKISKAEGLAFNIESGIPVSVNISSGAGSAAGVRNTEFSAGKRKGPII
ncbi:hypothetical protein OESDEN_25190 [Oesophagostomum dentatum]|uniref:Uncharacterized protein n=1 Tax=Oesophagostomum dentatum TaxID=61180 RepID=A0A0B1RRD5_OESDE|nr:hypothetical protein OESDEN_25190 [Oesophagostomum dentatum]